MIFKWFLLTVLWIVSVQSFSFFGLFKPRSKQTSSTQPPGFDFRLASVKSVTGSLPSIPLPKVKPIKSSSSTTANNNKQKPKPNNGQSSSSTNNNNSGGGKKAASGNAKSNPDHLPYLPTNLRTLAQLQYRPNITSNDSRALVNHLSPYQEAQLNLAHYTGTDLSCYIAPPAGTIVDMQKLMGFWTLVRKVNNGNGTDQNYVCEQIVYTATGPNTFDKIADVHFLHKFQTIKGNGTFLAPGIMILDWANLVDISKPQRLVYTVIATDYTEYVVGYNCKNNRPKPEVVLETRRTKVPLTILNEAYKAIQSNGLPLSDLVCSKGFNNSYVSIGDYF